MIQPVRQNQRRSLLNGICNELIPGGVFGKIGNELGVVQRSVRVKGFSAYLHPCTHRVDTYLHNLVSHSFVRDFVGNLTNEGVGSFNHSI